MTVERIFPTCPPLKDLTAEQIRLVRKSSRSRLYRYSSIWAREEEEQEKQVRRPGLCGAWRDLLEDIKSAGSVRFR